MGLVSPAQGLYLCAIDVKDGPRVLVPNRTVDGDGAPRTQNRAFMKLAWAAHGHAARHGHIEFRAGYPVLYYVSLVLLVMIGALFIVLAGLIVWALSQGKAMKLAPLGFPLFVSGVAVPLVLRLVKKNRPRTYSPTNIPDGLLPGPDDV